jgi:hypothetical protein
VLVELILAWWASSAGEMSNVPNGKSYANYREPGAGYSSYKEPGHGYNIPSVTTYGTTPIPDLFGELPVINEGVGNYHINHYIAFFNAPTKSANDCPKILTAFYNKFPFIFANAFTGNFATAAWGKGSDAERSDLGNLTFKGNKTIKFTVGGQLGGYINQLAGFGHDDWVSIQMEPRERKSFYALTLKRGWTTSNEEIARFAVPLVASPAGPIIGKLTVDEAIDINQRHFLAGRRSWRVGYDQSARLLFVETAALERSSHEFYRFMENFDWLRSQIDRIWIGLLVNFATIFKFELSIAAAASYTDPQSPYSLSSADVFHVSAERESLAEALKVDWFSSVIRRHVGLITDL